VGPHDVVAERPVQGGVTSESRARGAVPIPDHDGASPLQQVTEPMGRTVTAATADVRRTTHAGERARSWGARLTCCSPRARFEPLAWIRSDHRSVQALEADIRAWVKNWNEDPQPFIWTKTAEQILESLKRLLQRTTGAGH